MKAGTTYTAAQLRMVLETIAGRADTLTHLLCNARELGAEHWHAETSLEAAEALVRSIGAMADGASGCSIVGDADAWNYGPNFAELSQQHDTAADDAQRPGAAA